MAVIHHVEFSKFRLYVTYTSRHFTWPLLPCYSAAKNTHQNGGRSPSRVLKIFIFGHRVPNQNRMIFRWDMAISWFSRWRISAILIFSYPKIPSLKSLCRTFDRSSIETMALDCLIFFEKIAFLWNLATDGRTNIRMYGQHQRIKPPFLAVVSGGLIICSQNSPALYSKSGRYSSTFFSDAHAAFEDDDCDNQSNDNDYQQNDHDDKGCPCVWK